MPGTQPIIVQQLFHLPTEVIWKAITELNQMNKWFFKNIPEFEARVGFTTQFKVISGEKVFTHCWKIVEVNKMKLIKYRWSYSEYPGVGYVSFELNKTNEGTLLRLINEGLDSFPPEIPEFSRESCLAGWNFFIKENLKNYLEN